MPWDRSRGPPGADGRAEAAGHDELLGVAGDHRDRLCRRGAAVRAGRASGRTATGRAATHRTAGRPRRAWPAGRCHPCSGPAGWRRAGKRYRRRRHGRAPPCGSRCVSSRRAKPTLACGDASSESAASTDSHRGFPSSWTISCSVRINRAVTLTGLTPLSVAITGHDRGGVVEGYLDGDEAAPLTGLLELLPGVLFRVLAEPCGGFRS